MSLSRLLNRATFKANCRAQGCRKKTADLFRVQDGPLSFVVRLCRNHQIWPLQLKPANPKNLMVAK